MRLVPKQLNLSDSERLELQHLVNRHNTPQQLALRAKIILKSKDDLRTRILEFIDYFNKTMAKPFKLTYKGKVLAI